MSTTFVPSPHHVNAAEVRREAPPAPRRRSPAELAGLAVLYFLWTVVVLMAGFVAGHLVPGIFGE